MGTIAAQWLKIGCLGFGGPPTHIAMLRRLCVDQRGWLQAEEFEQGIAAANLLPGPASTQLAIYCAWRLRRTAGALVGGLCFIVPGLIVILGLSALFLSSHPPEWVQGAAAGAGSAVAAVAVHAALALAPASWNRSGRRSGGRLRWALYAGAGVAAGALAGTYLVLVLLGLGLLEVLRLLARRPPRALSTMLLAGLPLLPLAVTTAGGLGAVAWVAFKVGALSYGGGFVIIPLMQGDVVHHYHWMTNGQFLNAVALGQVTPGPVVQTVAAVGYAAGGLGAGLLASLVAFSPSFAFVLLGGPHFERLRGNAVAQAFLDGAGPGAIGAIFGAAIPLGLALAHLWQVAVLGGAMVWLLVVRRGGVVAVLVAAGVLGVVLAYAGLPVGA